MRYEVVSKLKAFSLALAVNALILGAASYMFDGTLHTSKVALMAATPVTAMPSASASEVRVHAIATI